MADGESFFPNASIGPKCPKCGKRFLPHVYVVEGEGGPQHVNCNDPFANPSPLDLIMNDRQENPPIVPPLPTDEEMKQIIEDSPVPPSLLEAILSGPPASQENPPEETGERQS